MPVKGDTYPFDTFYRGREELFRPTPVTIDIPPDTFVIKCDFHYDPQFFLGTYLYLCGYRFYCTKIEHNVDENCINLHYENAGKDPNKLGKVTIE
jgi:hypothetical protein